MQAGIFDFLTFKRQNIRISAITFYEKENYQKTSLKLLVIGPLHFVKFELNDPEGKGCLKKCLSQILR